MTTTKLSQRLTSHLTNGAPKKHLHEAHKTKITRQILEENTEIIDNCPDHRRLSILEALYIKELNPSLNIQAEDLQAIPSLRRKEGNSKYSAPEASKNPTPSQPISDDQAV